MSRLAGDERLVTHRGLKTIGLDELKEYIGATGTVVVNPVSDTIMKIAATVSLGGHRIVAQVGGVLRYADSLDLSCVNQVVGVTAGAVVGGEDAQVQFRGYMDEATWNWDLTKPIFVGHEGAMTQNPPSVGFCQQIATVVSTTRILINIQEPVVIGD